MQQFKVGLPILPPFILPFHSPSHSPVYMWLPLRSPQRALGDRGQECTLPLFTGRSKVGRRTQPSGVGREGAEIKAPEEEGVGRGWSPRGTISRRALHRALL